MPDSRPLPSYAAHAVQLGDLPVQRVLPVRERRMVGPWCFLDRFGPLSFTNAKPMDVAPHPHIGLQTVTWLLEGEILHNDSLGCEAIAHPGSVNVMTSGAGIAHAEQTPRQHTGKLNGVQLWVALPETRRHGPAAFQSVNRVPILELPGGLVRVFAGSLHNVTSPATHYSEILGLEAALHPNSLLEFDLHPAWEHALVVLEGDCQLEDHRLTPGALYDLGTGRASLALSARQPAKVLLLGGPPFPEKILMWWNFVARTPEEIAHARRQWEAAEHFGDVTAYNGPRLRAPELLPLRRP